LQPIRLFLRLIEDILRLAREDKLRAGGLGQALQFGADNLGDAPRISPEFSQDRSDDPLFLGQKSGQEMKGRDFTVVALLGEFLRSRDGFLCFDCELIESHVLIPYVIWLTLAIVR